MYVRTTPSVSSESYTPIISCQQAITSSLSDSSYTASYIYTSSPATQRSASKIYNSFPRVPDYNSLEYSGVQAKKSYHTPKDKDLSDIRLIDDKHNFHSSNNDFCECENPGCLAPSIRCHSVMEQSCTLRTHPFSGDGDLSMHVNGNAKDNFLSKGWNDSLQLTSECVSKYLRVTPTSISKENEHYLTNGMYSSQIFLNVSQIENVESSTKHSSPTSMITISSEHSLSSEVNHDHVRGQNSRIPTFSSGNEIHFIRKQPKKRQMNDVVHKPVSGINAIEYPAPR